MIFELLLVLTYHLNSRLIYLILRFVNLVPLNHLPFILVLKNLLLLLLILCHLFLHTCPSKLVIRIIILVVSMQRIVSKIHQRTLSLIAKVMHLLITQIVINVHNDFDVCSRQR